MLAGRPFTNPLVAARSFDDGIYVVDVDYTLWALGANGDITELGNYPDPPVATSLLAQTSRLGPDNALYQITSNDLSSELIIRRTIDGDSDIVYSESDSPNVKLDPFSSTLVTGP